jgi:hypothetical protein
LMSSATFRYRDSPVMKLKLIARGPPGGRAGPDGIERARSG